MTDVLVRFGDSTSVALGMKAHGVPIPPQNPSVAAHSVTSPRLLGEGGGFSTGSDSRRVPLTRRAKSAATSPRKRGEIKPHRPSIAAVIHRVMSFEARKSSATR